MQVLTGDFNAEPHEEALRFLSRKESFAGGCDHNLSPHGGDSSGRTQSPFVDTWKFTAVNSLSEGSTVWQTVHVYVYVHHDGGVHCLYIYCIRHLLCFLHIDSLETLIIH